jgi:hypothetical protein
VRAFAGVLAVTLTLTLAACSPATVSRCSIVGDGTKAAAVVTSHSAERITYVEILVAQGRARSEDGRRFKAFMSLQPFTSQTIELFAVDRYGYDFKDNSSDGCELEFARFANGTNWIAPTPI